MQLSRKFQVPILQLGGLVGWCWMDFSHHMEVGKEDDYTKSTWACCGLETHNHAIMSPMSYPLHHSDIQLTHTPHIHTIYNTHTLYQKMLLFLFTLTIHFIKNHFPSIDETMATDLFSWQQIFITYLIRLYNNSFSLYNAPP